MPRRPLSYLALLLLSILALLSLSRSALAATSEPWMDKLGALPVQDGGRVMPLDTYARNLAVQLTGRTHWSASSGPAAFAGKHHMELLCDLMFRGSDVAHQPLVIIENNAFKKAAGLDPKQRFFSPVQIGDCQPIEKMLVDLQKAKAINANTQPTRDQRQAQELQSDLDRVSFFLDGSQLAIVPNGVAKPFLHAGPKGGDPGTEKVSAALASFGAAYLAGHPNDAADALVSAIQSAGTLDPASAKAVSLELGYNTYKPWMITILCYSAALVLFGLSRLALKRPITIAAIIATVVGVIAHGAGVGLRVAILGRAPVSNTYEALIWMGLVAIAVGFVAQMINRRAWYFVAGVGVALLSVLFSNLVPLESQTNSLPAVLRSNYWLIVHVLTITSSYGVLAVASILGHVYLIRTVLLNKQDPDADPNLSHPLVAQTYRAMQLGLVLLTAGTILGGVWAADSWGRFWGWDPKETWALISIVVYFIILHARYLRWIQDFGLAAWAVLAFACIVWTFYGVNYLMASGLHSYGFGSGGGSWVAIWAIAEIIFLIACKLRQRQLDARLDAEQAVDLPSGAVTQRATPSAQ